jgi:hypothetical protein
MRRKSYYHASITLWKANVNVHREIKIWSTTINRVTTQINANNAIIQVIYPPVVELNQHNAVPKVLPKTPNNNDGTAKPRVDR